MLCRFTYACKGRLLRAVGHYQWCSFSTVSTVARRYFSAHSRIFSSSDEAQISHALAVQPGQVSEMIRHSMENSRKRILYFRSSVTYVTIILQSRLQARNISVCDAANVMSDLLKDCATLRQADMAHLLFRAGLRFHRYGVVIPAVFLKSLYQSYRGNRGMSAVMRNVSDELRKVEGLAFLSSLASVLASNDGPWVCAEEDILKLSPEDLIAVLECFGLIGKANEMIQLLSLILSKGKLLNADLSLLFSTSIVAVKSCSLSVEQIQSLVPSEVQLTDAAAAVLLQCRVDHRSTIDDIITEEKKVSALLSKDGMHPQFTATAVVKCAENHIYSSQANASTQARPFFAQKLADLCLCVRELFPTITMFSESDTAVAIAVLKGYGVQGEHAEMDKWFAELLTYGLLNSYRLYEEVLRWYSHARNVKKVLSIKDLMSERHIYHTVHAYHYVFRALDVFFPQLVEKYYHEMRIRGIRLDGHIAPLLLRAFGEAKQMEKVESLYADVKGIASKGFPNVFSSRVAIQMLRIFQSHPERCKEVFQDAQTFGVAADTAVQAEYISCLTANHQSGDVEKFLSHIPTKTPHVYRVLLRNAAKKKSRASFDSLVLEVEQQNMWDEKLLSTVITALSHVNDFAGVEKYVLLARERKLIQSSFFYADAASAFSRLGALQKVTELWEELLHSKLTIAMPVYSKFLDIYLAKNSITMVQVILDTMMRLLPPNPTTATAVIDMLGKMGRLDEMEAVLHSMTTSMNAAPTLSTLHTVMNAYAKVGNIDKMVEVQRRIQKDGFAESSLTFNILFEGYGRAKRYDKIRETMETLKELHGSLEESSYLVLLSIYSRDRLQEEVDSLVDSMIAAAVVFSNKLLAYIATAFAAVQNISQTEKYVQLLLAHPDCTTRDVETVYAIYARFRHTGKLQELLDDGSLSKTEPILNICVTAFAKAGDHAKVAHLLSEMEKYNYTLSRSTSIVLSSSLLKAGKSELAQEVLQWGSHDTSSSPSNQ